MYGNNCKVVEKISDKEFKVKMIDGSIMNGEIASGDSLQLETGDICYLAAVKVNENWLISFKGFTKFASPEDKRQLMNL